MAFILRLPFLEASNGIGFKTRQSAGLAAGVSMPPGKLDGARDQWGAVVQPEGKGGTMPYAWFVWEPGFVGKMSIERLPCSVLQRRRSAS